MPGRFPGGGPFGFTSDFNPVQRRPQMAAVLAFEERNNTLLDTPSLLLQVDKGSKGFLTTTSDFAPKLSDDILLQPFMPAQVELINGKALLARLKELAEKKA